MEIVVINEIKQTYTCQFHKTQLCLQSVIFQAAATEMCSVLKRESHRNIYGAANG